MLQIYFGGLKDERLGRIAFLAYWLLLAAFVVTGGLLIGFGVGVVDQLSGGDVPEARTGPRSAFGVPAVVAIWAAVLTALFAELNISAKRVRHIGFPAWPATLTVGVAILLVALLVSAKIGFGLAVLAWLALVLVPGGVAGSASSRE